VLIGVAADAYDQPIDYNPCLSCNLCVAACPVTAIKADGAFDFMTCYTHNYREFLGNFGEWAAEIADAKDAADYRRRVSAGESRSMWQSLSFKPGYKAAYCVSVCPAGEDVIAPFLDDRKDYTERVVRPLRDKPETLYVLAGSDAEHESPRRFPRKAIKPVAPSLRPSSIPAFLMLLRLGFQRGRAKGLSARYQFRFRGEPNSDVTVHIDQQQLSIEPRLVGDADLSLQVDGAVWLQIVNGELPWRDALARGIATVTGSLELVQAFSACFPNLATLS
jgi:ferredoxin